MRAKINPGPQASRPSAQSDRAIRPRPLSKPAHSCSLLSYPEAPRPQFALETGPPLCPEKQEASEPSGFIHPRPRLRRPASSGNQLRPTTQALLGPLLLLGALCKWGVPAGDGAERPIWKVCARAQGRGRPPFPEPRSWCNRGWKSGWPGSLESKSVWARRQPGRSPASPGRSLRCPEGPRTSRKVEGGSACGTLCGRAPGLLCAECKTL